MRPGQAWAEQLPSRSQTFQLLTLLIRQSRIVRATAAVALHAVVEESARGHDQFVGTPVQIALLSWSIGPERILASTRANSSCNS